MDQNRLPVPLQQALGLPLGSQEDGQLLQNFHEHLDAFRSAIPDRLDAQDPTGDRLDADDPTWDRLKRIQVNESHRTAIRDLMIATLTADAQTASFDLVIPGLAMLLWLDLWESELQNPDWQALVEAFQANGEASKHLANRLGPPLSPQHRARAVCRLLAQDDGISSVGPTAEAMWRSGPCDWTAQVALLEEESGWEKVGLRLWGETVSWAMSRAMLASLANPIQAGKVSLEHDQKAACWAVFAPLMDRFHTEEELSAHLATHPLPSWLEGLVLLLQKPGLPQDEAEDAPGTYRDRWLDALLRPDQLTMQSSSELRVALSMGARQGAEVFNALFQRIAPHWSPSKEDLRILVNQLANWPLQPALIAFCQRAPEVVGWQIIESLAYGRPLPTAFGDPCAWPWPMKAYLEHMAQRDNQADYFELLSEDMLANWSAVLDGQAHPLSVRDHLFEAGRALRPHWREAQYRAHDRDQILQAQPASLRSRRPRS